MTTQTDAVRVLALLESSTGAGPARNLIEFARRAASGPFSAAISLVTFQRGSAEPPSAFVVAARRAGVPIDVLVERRSFDSAVLRQLRSLVAQRQPHIIETHNMKSHLLICLLGLQRKYPWIAVHHGYTAMDLKDRLYRYFDRWSLPRACRVLTVCNAFAADMRRAGVPAARIVVQHNAAPEFLSPPPGEAGRLRQRLGIPAGVPVVLALGRLSAEKGHRDLIEAAAILRDRWPALPFRLVLAGDGPERARLERACRRPGLQDAVILVGHQADVRPYYAMARLLALPSHSEGSPNVVLEAMAAGVPLVATSVGGVPEIVRDGANGLLVRPRDPVRMAAAIARLLEDPALANTLSTAARSIVAEEYSPGPRRLRLLRLYRDVLQSDAWRGATPAPVS